MLRQAKSLLIDFFSRLLLIAICIYLLFQVNPLLSPLILLTIAIMVYSSISWLLQPMEYLPATLKSIKLDYLGCPKVIEDKMKELTQDGEPINRIIVEILDKEESLSQTEICEKVMKRGVSLSRTRIIAYIDELVRNELLKLNRQRGKGELRRHTNLQRLENGS